MTDKPTYSYEYESVRYMVLGRGSAWDVQFLNTVLMGEALAGVDFLLTMGKVCGCGSTFGRLLTLLLEGGQDLQKTIVNIEQSVARVNASDRRLRALLPPPPRRSLGPPLRGFPQENLRTRQK